MSITAEAGLPLISMGTIMDKPLDSFELEALNTFSLMAGLGVLDSGATLLFEDLSCGKLLTLGGGGDDCACSPKLC